MSDDFGEVDATMDGAVDECVFICIINRARRRPRHSMSFCISCSYTLLDTSRVSTFFIAIMLIVYGSFRSLNLEAENRLKEKTGDTSAVAGEFILSAILHKN